MTQSQRQAGAGHLPIILDRAISECGAWTVLKAALMALLWGQDRAARRDPRGLNAHLRRDIGMPQAGHPRRADRFRF